MFAVIMTWLSTNFPTMSAFIGSVVDGGIGLVYNGTALTQLGELIFFGSLVGIGWFALSYVIRLIPFAK